MSSLNHNKLSNKLNGNRTICNESCIHRDEKKHVEIEKLLSYSELPRKVRLEILKHNQIALENFFNGVTAEKDVIPLIELDGDIFIVTGMNDEFLEVIENSKNPKKIKIKNEFKISLVKINGLWKKFTFTLRKKFKTNYMQTLFNLNLEGLC